MVPAGNKVKCLLSVNHTTKTIHHHHHSSTLKSLKSTKFIFQNNIIATFIYLKVIRVNYIVGTPLPYLPKTESLGGVTKCFVRKGDKLEKGGCHFFITLQFNHIYCVCGESKVSFIAVLFITFFITFLIHCGSLQKILTALFNLV